MSYKELVSTAKERGIVLPPSPAVATKGTDTKYWYNDRLYTTLEELINQIIEDFKLK